MAHIEDLLPVIRFTNMSPRLNEFLLETDCATTKQMVFFDTMPAMHRATAAPGLNQVCSIDDPTILFFHFDAAEVHETIIAHELGHVWVELVSGCEDYRYLREPFNFARSSQFSNIQSFVMDLRVNELLESRGFDMSIISGHQAESIRNFAAHCVRGDRPQYRRLLGSVINAIAAALLEMERFPAAWGDALRDSFEMIRIGMPDAFEAAVGFVASVKRHGYADSAAVCSVVDECAQISFAITGDGIDTEKDTIEIRHEGSMRDKHPEFLPQLPLAAKLEVLRTTANLGITGRAKYELFVSPTRLATVTVSDPDLQICNPVQFHYQLPERPHNLYRMPGAPIPSARPRSAYNPPPGVSYPAETPFSESLPASGTAQCESGPRPMPCIGPPSTASPWGFDGWQAVAPASDIPDALPGFIGIQPTPISTFPREMLAPLLRHNNRENSPGALAEAAMRSGRSLGLGQPSFWPDAPQPFIPQYQAAPPLAPACSPNQAVNQRVTIPPRHRTDELPTLRPVTPPEYYNTVHAVYSGGDLAPRLATEPIDRDSADLPGASESCRCNVIRNYMAGFGLWISRVGFGQQMDGEHPYGYAMNNPVTNIDPLGQVPCPLQTCCCTINGKPQLKVVPVDDIIEWGNNITPIVSMSWVPSSKSTQCSIKWEEKANYSYNTGVPVNKWFNVCKIPSLECPNDDDFPGNIPQPCPSGPITWEQFTDNPDILKVPANYPINWMLCIKITLTDGCTGKSQVLTFHQQIKVNKAGKLVSMTPPSKSAELEKYCSK